MITNTKFREKNLDYTSLRNASSLSAEVESYQRLMTASLPPVARISVFFPTANAHTCSHISRRNMRQILEREKEVRNPNLIMPPATNVASPLLQSFDSTKCNSFNSPMGHQSYTEFHKTNYLFAETKGYSKALGV